jgi:hypothetical protein
MKKCIKCPRMHNQPTAKCRHCLILDRRYREARYKSIRGKACITCYAKLPSRYSFKQCEPCRAKQRKDPGPAVKRKCNRCPAVFIGTAKSCPACVEKRARAAAKKKATPGLRTCSRCSDYLPFDRAWRYKKCPRCRGDRTHGYIACSGCGRERHSTLITSQGVNDPVCAACSMQLELTGVPRAGRG